MQILCCHSWTRSKVLTETSLFLTEFASFANTRQCNTKCLYRVILLLMRELEINGTIMKHTHESVAYRKQNSQVILKRSEITKSAVNLKIKDSPLREI